ncbi:MAG: polysaccharide deacetylase family protein, partial [Chthoniobacteraceae bacterium]
NPFREGPTPVLLTHDIDSPEGLEKLVDRFLPLEEAVGARSCNFVVPFKWDLDEARLQEVVTRGHSLGIHGYDHSNRTPFLAPAERKERLDAASPLIEKFGITGYRAPSLCRTEELLADLSGRYRFDSSIPTSGGLFPTPGNGCATARPYRTGHGELVELPLSMPRDGSLRFLGHSPDEILTLWKTCAADIAASGGVVVLLTHCESVFSGNAPMLAAYSGFLEWISASPDFAWSKPEAVLDRFNRSAAAPLTAP